MTYNKKILSIDSNDDNENYEAFDEFLQEDTKRRKISMSSEIEKMGEIYLSEIDQKNAEKEVKKQEMIKYILQNSKHTRFVGIDSYSYKDVLMIYNKIKKENISIFSKIFHFIFNLE